jgi:hypothetical protein
MRRPAEVAPPEPPAVLAEKDDGIEIGRGELSQVRHEIGQDQRGDRHRPAARVRLRGAIVERPVVPLAQRVGQ